MPEYRYRCPNGHEQSITHPMSWPGPVLCDTCGSVMQKRPQVLSVNWKGLRPSKGEVGPIIRNLLDTAPRRRDEFMEQHDAHEKRTARQTADDYGSL